MNIWMNEIWIRLDILLLFNFFDGCRRISDLASDRPAVERPPFGPVSAPGTAGGTSLFLRAGRLYADVSAFQRF